MKKFLILIALISLGIIPAQAADLPAVPPAGDYQLDKAHASVTFRVLHLGLSHYTARFTHLDAALHLDPEHPENSRLTATVDPHSIRTDYPNPKPDFDAELQNDKWLDSGKYPEIKFTSTKIEPTGATTARVTGDLELHGVKLPVTLETTYNGYMNLKWGKPEDHIGFSARGSLKRSAFGIKEGIPEAGSNMGVGDDVEIIIEAEFFKPEAEEKKPDEQKK
jgi:polyisoprenoid-binding protein YceI